MKRLTFDDISITPQFSRVPSREAVKTTTQLHPKLSLELPIISSNMVNISGPKMAKEMSANGGLTILPRHRNDPEYDVKQFLEANFMCGSGIVGASVGVKDSDKNLFDNLYFSGCRVFAIDVANGDHQNVKDMLCWVRSMNCSKECVIIAGNVATYDSTMHLAEWGADIIKVGIAPGKVCRTRDNTGVYVPQFHALRECGRAIRDNGLLQKLIADGGIEKYGDVSKALIFAHAVMVGFLISGTSETPGDVYPDDKGGFYKMYGGSTSGQNKNENEGHSKFIEGTMIKVVLNGHVKYILRGIKHGIQSAFSYSNAFNIEEYHKNVIWEEV
jgi:IMP dehydrogenase/GMP reductase